MERSIRYVFRIFLFSRLHSRLPNSRQTLYWELWYTTPILKQMKEKERRKKLALKQEMKIVTDDSDAMTRQEGKVWKMMISRSFFWWLKFHSISYHCGPLWTISKYHQHHTVVNTQWGLRPLHIFTIHIKTKTVVRSLTSLMRYLCTSDLKLLISD